MNNGPIGGPIEEQAAAAVSHDTADPMPSQTEAGGAGEPVLQSNPTGDLLRAQNAYNKLLLRVLHKQAQPSEIMQGQEDYIMALTNFLEDMGVL